MAKKIKDLVALSMLIAYQSYFPSIYSGVKIVERLRDSQSVGHNSINHSRETNDIPTVQVGEEGIIIYQPNSQEKAIEKNKKNISFNEIEMKIAKLEEKIHITGKGTESTVFGYQLSLISGILLIGSRRVG